MAPAAVYVAAMPSTYVSDSAKPRRGETAPWPTMMLDRIGTIGSTQPVNATPRPPKKNPPSSAAHEPVTSAAHRSCSETGSDPAPPEADPEADAGNSLVAGSTSAIVRSPGG